MTIGAAASTLVPTKQIDPTGIHGRRLLPAIIDAQAAVIHPLNCLDLSAKAKQVLKALIGYFNVKKGGFIFPSRETLSIELGMPESTLRRWLAVLVEKQYIERETQRRRPTSRFAPGRQFSVTPLRFTEKALTLSGLKTKPVIHKPAPIKVSVANKEERRTKVVSKKQGRQPREGQSAEPTIPKDLQPLAELGMLPQTICKLMRTAKDNGKLLSDVLVVVRKRLEELKLKGGQIRNYILKAIASKTDFAALAKRVGEQERQAEKAAADADYIEQFRQQYAGKCLYSPDGRERVAIHANGKNAVHLLGSRTGSLPLETRTDVAYLVEKIKRGILREGAPNTQNTGCAGPVRSSTITEHLAVIRKTVGLRAGV